MNYAPETNAKELVEVMKLTRELHTPDTRESPPELTKVIDQRLTEAILEGDIKKFREAGNLIHKLGNTGYWEVLQLKFQETLQRAPITEGFRRNVMWYYQLGLYENEARTLLGIDLTKDEYGIFDPSKAQYIEKEDLVKTLGLTIEDMLFELTREEPEEDLENAEDLSSGIRRLTETTRLIREFPNRFPLGFGSLGHIYQRFRHVYEWGREFASIYNDEEVARYMSDLQEI